MHRHAILVSAPHLVLVLRYILLDHRNHSYCLRPKRHELTLAIQGRDSQNFFQRLSFKDMH